MPYRGTAPAMTISVAGHIQMLFDCCRSLPQISCGTVRALAKPMQAHAPEGSADRAKQACPVSMHCVGAWHRAGP